MYGAIIGDIIGSRFEFDRGNKSKEFELFTSECDFTDDTVMTVAVAEALMDAGPDADEKTVKKELVRSMKKWGQKYPHAGYGARFIDWVLSEDPEPYGSYGNGSGMRVSSVGWLYGSLERVREVARWTAEVTHNHPEGIKGAESTAAAIFMARNGASKDEIKDYIVREFGYDLSRSLDEIRPGYQHVEDCMRTMPEAFECFLEAESYEDCIRNVMYIGGDTDTLGAIAGAIAEAFWGIPVSIVIDAKDFIPEDIGSVISRINKAICGSDSKRSSEYSNNRCIKEAGGKAGKPGDVDSKFAFLKAIHDRTIEGGEVPMPMVDVNGVLGNISPEDIKLGKDFVLGQEMRLRMDTVFDENGNEWFPLYTDMDEIEGHVPSCITMNVPIRTILENALNSDRVMGVAVNPFTDQMLLAKKIVGVILDEWEGDKKEE